MAATPLVEQLAEPEPEPEPEDFGKKELPDLPPPQGGESLQPVNDEEDSNVLLKVAIVAAFGIVLASGFIFLL